jgi:hypothetical protein
LKYRDLVDFQPIEEIIELRDAGKESRARELVGTYVISEQMSRQMSEYIGANLDFAAPDAKGIVVIGNYGTGKSHLMAVVSAVAERADLLALIGHEGVRKAFEPVAGKYLVARMELGAVKTPLRDIIVRELERNLKSWGVDYTFPAQDEITNHKDAIEAMLGAVEAQHPGKGVLLVIDELLDYLRALRQEEVIGHFNFLRELGEASGNGRFRVMAGVQESLFDSPAFAFIANVVQRVQARYLQVLITSDDLAYVVESRLLKKTDNQRAKIRSHLERFAPLFPHLQAKLDDYVRLFPIHPRYIEVFEEVEIAEKREVLRTLSQEIKARLDADVPAETPGVVAYDSYWDVIARTPSFLADVRVGEVENKASVVLNRVRTAYPNVALKPAAERVVAALGVYRLAVGDIRKPIGLTAENLRDDLTLMVPNLPEQEPEFLTTTIESVLKNIRTTVNGQFISSGDNGQYYVDLDRFIDYEAKIDERVGRISESQADQFYFSILAQVMERPTSTYVPGFRIWEYEVEWPGHRVTRPGYLFFGGPNDRSTAQPPRAFYIYFLGVFDQKPFDDKRKDDEVILTLAHPDDEFLQTVKRYASAQEWAQNSSGDEKLQYQSLAEKHFRAASKWIVAHLPHAFDVTHEGQTQTVAQALAADRPTAGGSSTRDTVNSIASALLAGSFDRRWPQYPAFRRLTAPVTEESRPQAASEALRFVGGSLRTQQGSAVLDGLRLLHGDAINSDGSPYAKHVLRVLAGKPEGHVVNRDELLQRIDGVDREPHYGLEPEWIAVILAALAYRGEVEISVNGTTIDAVSVGQVASLSAGALSNFRSYQRPKGLPIAALRRLFEMLGLQVALLDADRDRAAADLQSAIAREIPVALDVARLGPTTRIWGSDVWSPHDAQAIATDAADYKTFLDRLTSMNTGAKLRHLKESADEVAALADKRKQVVAAQTRLDALKPLAALGEYLSSALAVLGPDDPMTAEIVGAQPIAVKAAQSGSNIADAVRHLENLLSRYVSRYLELHRRARLGSHEDQRKKSIIESAPMKRLDALANVTILPGAQLIDLKKELASLRPCWAADEQQLEQTPYCTACMFKPLVDAAPADADMRLNELEDRVQGLDTEWVTFIRDGLDDPVAKAGLDLLSPQDQEAALQAIEADDVPSSDAIKALNTVFGGLQKISLPAADVVDALRKGGPSTPEELEQRLDAYLAARLAGTDPKKARIVIE